MARRCCRSAQDDVVFSAAKLFFAYGLGNAMTFPMSVGATTVLFNGRPTPRGVVRNSRPLQADRVLRRADALRRDGARNSKPGRVRFAAPLRRCISAGEALPEEVGAQMARASPASTFSTASARPKCCTSSSPTAPATSSTAPRASPCPATTSASSTSTTARWRRARSANCWCAAPRPRRIIGTGARRAARPSAATGPTPATNTRSWPAGATAIAAAPTTCSRSAASGSRRSRSSRR